MYYAFHTFFNSQEFYNTPWDKVLYSLSADSPLPPNRNPKPDSSINPTWQYYCKGAVAGMTGILLSHPVDTIKTHVQTGRALRDFTPSVRNCYRGLLAPLVGVGLEKAVVFGTYNWALREIGSIPLAGGVAGLSAAVIVTPYERLKILRQNEVGITKKDFTVKYLFRGLGATWTREVPGFAIYFSVYETLKHHTHGQHGREIGYVNSFLYGGLAGVAAWIFIYPQDRIKTIIQASGHASGQASSQSGTTKITKKGFQDVLLDIYRAGGIRHFYSGFSWAVARAMLLHSGTFCVMEFLNRQF